jgi:hypothetical protein
MDETEILVDPEEVFGALAHLYSAIMNLFSNADNGEFRTSDVRELKTAMEKSLAILKDAHYQINETKLQ